MQQSPYHIELEASQIGDQKSYRKLLTYIQRRIHCCDWIYGDFASHEEIISEVYLNIKNGDDIIKVTNRIISRMWYDYIKSHPEKYKAHNARIRDWKKDQRDNLTDYYVSNSESQRLRYHRVVKSASDIRNDKEAMLSARNRIKRNRVS